KDAPEYSFDAYSGRLVFYWSLGTEVGKAKLKESPALQAKAAALDNKDDDYLVEVIDAFAQKTVATLLLDTGRGSFDIGDALSEGNWLILHDSHKRVLVYSIKDGELHHRFFGSSAAINPRKGRTALEISAGETTLYVLERGHREGGIIINGSPAFVSFNLEGDKLFVLSETQSAYVFDVNKLAAKQAAPLNPPN